MTATPATLIAHDLKNALAALENELAVLSANPDVRLAAQAHQRCATLRREFVQFLMVYGVISVSAQRVPPSVKWKPLMHWSAVR